MTLWSDKLAPEVESFGYVLFEMAMGYEFDTTVGKTKEEVFDSLLNRVAEKKCHPQITSILHQIFFESNLSIMNPAKNTNSNSDPSSSTTNGTTTPTVDASTTNGSATTSTNGTTPSTDATTSSTPNNVLNVPTVEDLLAFPFFANLGLQQPLPPQRQLSVKERKYLKAVKKVCFEFFRVIYSSS